MNDLLKAMLDALLVIGIIVGALLVVLTFFIHILLGVIIFFVALSGIFFYIKKYS